MTGAFLYASFPFDLCIWLKISRIPNVQGANGSKVRLIKSLYSLIQTLKLWYKLIREYLVFIGFKELRSVGCLFDRVHKGIAG